MSAQFIRKNSLRRLDGAIPNEVYFYQIKEESLLSAQEEIELAERIALGDAAAKDRMTRANLRLVVNIARDYLGRGMPLEDLIEEGNLGLMRAVVGFSPKYGTRFSTYASYWIKQAIRIAFFNLARPVRLPVHAHGLLTRWRRMQRKLSKTLGRPATEDEVAAALKFSPKKMKKIVRPALIASRSFPRSTNTKAEDPEFPLEEQLVDHRPVFLGSSAEDAEALDKIRKVMGRMEVRHATVLSLRFGLTEGKAPLTLKEVGERLGLTRERVRQIELEAIIYIQKELGQELTPNLQAFKKRRAKQKNRAHNP